MSHNKFTELELEAQADAIMERFDFKKVVKHMENTNHYWSFREGMAVPNEEQVRVVVRSLLTKAIYDDNHCANVGTGGFVAYKMPWGLQLTFQLAWS